MHTHGEEWCLSELIRLRGEVLAMQGRRTEAVRCYNEAIAVAQRQHAAAMELAVAASLRRLEEHVIPE